MHTQKHLGMIAGLSVLSLISGFTLCTSFGSAVSGGPALFLGLASLGAAAATGWTLFQRLQSLTAANTEDGNVPLVATYHDDRDSGDHEQIRVRKALDNVDANVMIADSENNIVYVNQSVLELFTDKEAEIRTEIPSFSASALVGTNMDVFHKSPAHQKRLIGELKSSISSQATVAGITFRITANPLSDNEGARIGTVVEWDDITEELAAQEEALKNSRITQALDKASANIMLADAENKIIYMNETVLGMFRSAESKIREQLPNFDTNKLIGSSMDVFHKDPSHQKSLVGSLREVYSAEAEVAGLTFRITANPLFDADNHRIGTVVEWLDRTQEISVEEEVSGIVESALSGDLSQRIELAGKSGFFRKLSEGVNALVDVCDQVVMDTVRVFGALSKGDLSQNIEREYMGSFEQLKRDANSTIERLVEVVGNIKSASGSVATGADELAQGNMNLSQRTEEQASSLEETASSMEEMTSTVQQNASNAREADNLAKEARDKAEHGGHVVGEAVRAMAEINGASKRIADIIGVIDEIAFQTNLLALNASVEAARAGEQGRGFAVVASEVRNLAGRSATAAKEIKELIEDSVSKVSEGSKLVDESGKTLEEIVSSVQQVTAIVGEISAASVEQASGIEEVNRAVTHMDEMTQQNAALVEEAAAASESIGDQAQQLNELVSFFQLDELPSSIRNIVSKKAVGDHAESRKEVPPIAAKPKLQVLNGGDDWQEF
jgi:methyl-accepting chemotaxis protein